MLILMLIFLKEGLQADDEGIYKCTYLDGESDQVGVCLAGNKVN